MSKDTKMFQPAGGRVVLERATTTEISAGGIHIPATAQAESQKATVKAMGPLVSTELLEVGDIVLVPKYAGSDVELNGKPYVIIQYEDIIGRFV